ncbi:putative ribonuclease H-like domain-containing protein [Tanacetum coccineum]
MEAGTTSTTLTPKLPILNPWDYDLWLMRIEQYFLMIDYSLWEVIKNDNKVLKRTVGETEQEYEPTTAEEKQDRRNEMKARGTLLMGLPNKDQLKFHSYKDAKLLMEAIEKKYGGNKESKKFQRTLLKQQYENFAGLSSEIMDKLLIGSSNTSQNPQNVAFVSSNSTNSTNEADNTAHGVSDAHTQSNPTSRDNLSDADLEQIDPVDLEEMDLQYEMAMLTIKARRFIKRTDKKLDVNGQRVGFNRSKVECYNFHKYGHFARECRSPRNQENRGREINRRTVTVETPTENALVAQDGIGGYDWSYQAGEKHPTNFVLMAFTSSGSSSSSDFEVDSCSKSCVKAYATLKEQYDIKLRDNALVENKKKLEKAEKERDELKLTLEKFQNSSKSLNNLLESQVIDKFKTGLGYIATSSTAASPAVESFVNSPEMLENQYENMNVTTIVTPSNVKTVELNQESAGVKSNGDVVEPKIVRKNSFRPPIIKDWNSNDESEVEIIPKDKTVSSSTKKIKFVKSARETVEKGNPQQKEYKEKGVIDSGCSRHMTGNKCYLTEYEDYDGGFVSFRDGKGRISRKGKIKTGTLDFDNVYFCKELKYNLFSVSQICDKKNNVLFTDTECLVLSFDFKLLDESQVLLRVPRKDNIYSVDLKSVVPTKGLTCLFAKATIDESNLWHRRLGHINFKNINKLVKGNLVRGLPSKIFENNHSCVACQKGKQHKASCKTKLVNSIIKPLHMLHMDLFGPTNVKSLMKKSYCLVVTDDFSRFSWVFFLATKDETSGILKTFITEIENQLDYKVKVIRSDNGTEFKNSNGVAERMNRTLIEAARTMLVDSKLPTTFWAEVVNTTCYMLNRVLVIKPHNKTPYELIHGRTPLIDFMKPFGCLVTILNTRDHLGKFNGKADEGFFIGYSVVSKAMREFNKRNMIVEETLNIRFLKNTPNVTGYEPDWLFDVDSLTISMNYVPVVAGNQTNDLKVSEEDAKEKATKMDESRASDKDGKDEQATRSDAAGPSFTNDDPSSPVNAAEASNAYEEHLFERFFPFKNAFTLPPISNVTPIVDTRIFDNAYDDEDVGADANLNNLETTIKAGPIPTTRMDNDHPKDQIIRDFNSSIQTRRVTKISDEHAMKVIQALEDSSWIEAMQEELLQFQLQKMDVKSALLYGTIEEEVYVCQPPGFEDPQFPDKVYKVEKALYGLHQAPRAWYETLSTYLVKNGFRRGTIDKTLFIKKEKVQQKEDGIFISQDKYVADILKKFDFATVKTSSTPMEPNKALIKDKEVDSVDVHLYRSMIGSLMYLTASRPDITFDVCACARFQVTLKTSHLHVVKRIFRYLKGQPKLGLWYHRDSPFDLEAFSYSDYARASLDRKSTIRGCQFLGKRLISWQCKKQTIVANSITKAEYVAAANCYGQNTATSKTINSVKQIHAIVDGKAVVISESSVRSDLLFNDKDGIACLTNDEIFKNLALMGYEQLSTKLTFQKDHEADEAVYKEGTRSERVLEKPNEPPLLEGHTFGSGEGSMEHTFELMDNVPPTPHDLPLSGGYTPGSDEGRLKLKELMAILKSQEIRKEEEVKHLTPNKEDIQADSDFDVLDDDMEDVEGETVHTATIGVSAVSAPVTTTGVAISTAQPRTPPTTAATAFIDEDLTIAQTLIKMKEEKVKEKGVAIKDVEDSPKPIRSINTLQLLPTIDPKDKELAQRLHDEELAELDKAQKERQKQEEATSAALAEEFDKIQARIDADHELAVRLTHEEQEKYTIEERARLLEEFFERRKKQLAAERVEEIRNKPPIRTQVRNMMITYLKHMKSTKKRPIANSKEESSKKQKLEEDNDAEKEELRDSMDVVPRDDVAIDVESLATKYLIVDWKIHILNENMMYYQIIRADGSSKNYKIFSEMLDGFDRQDVIDLHRLVNERYKITSLEGYDLLLWGDLKTFFEPNEEDEI